MTLTENEKPAVRLSFKDYKTLDLFVDTVLDLLDKVGIQYDRETLR